MMKTFRLCLLFLQKPIEIGVEVCIGVAVKSKDKGQF